MMTTRSRVVYVHTNGRADAEIFLDSCCEALASCSASPSGSSSPAAGPWSPPCGGTGERLDPRAIAEAVFRERLGPVLRSPSATPRRATCLSMASGSGCRLGDERLRLDYADFPV